LLLLSMDYYKVLKPSVCDEEVPSVGHRIWEWRFFQTSKTTTKVMGHLVLEKLDAFHHYHVDMDNYKCPLSWWCMKNPKFPVVGLLAYQICENPTSQIKIVEFFDWSNCHYTLEVFVTNWTPQLDDFY
jgi:hypothetical protein